MSEPALKEEFLINESDFKSIEIEIDIVNKTAHTEIRGGKRIMGEETLRDLNLSETENSPPALIEFTENGMVLEIPPQLCSKGHVLGLELRTKNVVPPLVFKPNLRVDLIEKLPDGRDRVELSFTRKTESEWQALLSIFNQRQEEILQFFENVKP